MKKVKKILKVVLFTIIFGIVYSFFFTTYENIKVNRVIKEFKSRGTFEKRILLESHGVEYYRDYYIVSRETSHELNDKNNVFKDANKNKLGIDGDIFVTQQSPFPNIPLMHAFMSYYYGGHAALLNYDYFGDPYFVEATGFPDKDNGETIFTYIFNSGNEENHGLNATTYNNGTNYWQKPFALSNNDYFDGMFYRTKYAGLRPVNPYLGTDKEDLYNDYINEAVRIGQNKVEEERLYNFLFFLNMRYKYYCTDLMSRIYEEAYENVYNNKEDYRAKGYAKKMNDDGFITSVQDLILSRDTYMVFYVEIEEKLINGENIIVESIYYLEDLSDSV